MTQVAVPVADLVEAMNRFAVAFEDADIQALAEESRRTIQELAKNGDASRDGFTKAAMNLLMNGKSGHLCLLVAFASLAQMLIASHKENGTFGFEEL